MTISGGTWRTARLKISSPCAIRLRESSGSLLPLRDNHALKVVILRPPCSTSSHDEGVRLPAPSWGKYVGVSGVTVWVSCTVVLVRKGSVKRHGDSEPKARRRKFRTPPLACSADRSPACDSGKLSRLSITWSVKTPSWKRAMSSAWALVMQLVVSVGGLQGGSRSKALAAPITWPRRLVILWRPSHSTALSKRIFVLTKGRRNSASVAGVPRGNVPNSSVVCGATTNSGFAGNPLSIRVTPSARVKL